ncbi:MAG: tRNA methyltransferase, partial [Rhizobiales bacterium]|nr:tRNA methyltransferase [Hyphomicrobiales bacterium]
MTLSLALYQPDIPQNTATLLRTGACLGVPVHVIQPAGFALSDKNFRRAGMDYLDKASLVQHADWAAFQVYCSEENRRIILLST